MDPTNNGVDLTADLGPDDEDPGCSWCERASGAVLVTGALGLLYIGVDLLTGGWLSRLFVSGVTRAADAIDPGGELAGQAVTGGPESGSNAADTD